jgi:hypothetical protein
MKLIAGLEPCKSLTKKVHVFLNGVEQKLVSEADDKTGCVVRCVVDAKGNVQSDPNDPDVVLTQRVYGRVKIRAKGVIGCKNQIGDRRDGC